MGNVIQCDVLVFGNEACLSASLTFVQSIITSWTFSLKFLLLLNCTIRHAHLPCLTFGASRLLHLSIAEAVSVRPSAHAQKVTVTQGYVNGRKPEIDIKAKN